MYSKKRIGLFGFLFLILLLCYGPVFAAPIYDDPVFKLPNDVANTPYTFPSQRVVADGYSLTAFYNIGDVQYRTDTGAVFTKNPGSLSLGDPDHYYAQVYADPTNLETKAYHLAQSDGSVNYYSYGNSQAWNWFVLKGGNPGDSVTLSTDMLIQGNAYAQGDAGANTATIFVSRLGFLSSPSDLTQDYVTTLAGTVNWTGGLAEQNTSDGLDVFWSQGDEIHTINYILRSQPFTVTVGTPFRLSMTMGAQGFASPGAWSKAWSDFYDPIFVTIDDYPDIPELTPNGFSVLEGGKYYTLGDKGYSLGSAVPEPTTLTLLGFGALGLLFRRKKSHK